jgi:hypothetical protein
MLLAVKGERGIGGREIEDFRIEGRHACSRVVGEKCESGRSHNGPEDYA